MIINKNKTFRDPRYFLREQEEEQKEPVAQVQIGAAKAFSPDTGDPNESVLGFKPGTDQPSLNGAGAVVERARSVVGKGWTYSLTGCPECRGNEKDPKPDPRLVPMGSSGATCDCSGYVSWAYGFGQKSLPGNGKLGDYLKNEVLHPQPGDIIARGNLPTTNYPHFGIVTAVNPPNATDKMINDGQADVSVVHCSSKNGPIEVENAIKGGWAGPFKERVPVAFFRPQELMNNKFLSAGSVQQQSQQVVSPKQVAKENKMRVNKWDILMHRLLTEKKEKELKEKRFAGKKELDKDGDGVPKWADKDDSDSKVGSKKSSKKKGGKIPPQLKMHIKKKKNKLDEAIEKLENILINEQVSVIDNVEQHEHFDYDSGDIEAYIRFAVPTDINFKRMVNDKIRSGEFTPKQDVASSPEYQYWVEQVKDLNTKLSNVSKVKKVQSDLVIVVIGDSKEPILQFKDKIEENKQEVDKLGGNYLIVKGSGVVGDFSKKPLEKGEMNKYAISFGLKKLTDQSFIENDEEISAPGSISGGRVEEIIKRIEKMLLEELTDSVFQTDINPLDEYGDDRHPPIGDDYDDDDDFEDDDDMDLDDEDDYDDEEDFMEEGVEYLSEAEVKKKKPRLGKVTRNPSGSKKKFHVYVKCGGRVKKISFGDPGLSIKRDSPARRKNFRARHKCDKPAGKDRCTARYWSCYQWRAGKKVEGE